MAKTLDDVIASLPPEEQASVLAEKARLEAEGVEFMRCPMCDSLACAANTLIGWWWCLACERGGWTHSEED